MKKDIPLCPCGQPCAYYGPVGGYSARCVKCNAKNAKRQREARAKAKAEPKSASPIVWLIDALIILVMKDTTFMSLVLRVLLGKPTPAERKKLAAEVEANAHRREEFDRLLMGMLRIAHMARDQQSFAE